jgi:hypothetical protein
MVVLASAVSTAPGGSAAAAVAVTLTKPVAAKPTVHLLIITLMPWLLIGCSLKAAPRRRFAEMNGCQKSNYRPDVNPPFQ